VLKKSLDSFNDWKLPFLSTQGRTFFFTTFRSLHIRSEEETLLNVSFASCFSVNLIATPGQVLCSTLGANPNSHLRVTLAIYCVFQFLSFKMGINHVSIVKIHTTQLPQRAKITGQEQQLNPACRGGMSRPCPNHVLPLQPLSQSQDKWDPTLPKKEEIQVQLLPSMSDLQPPTCRCLPLQVLHTFYFLSLEGLGSPSFVSSPSQFYCVSEGHKLTLFLRWSSSVSLLTTPEFSVFIGEQKQSFKN
jgi:hypothetical protein